MRNMRKGRISVKILAIFLILVLNLGAFDGLIRFTAQEIVRVDFTGFLSGAAAGTPTVIEKSKNKLPDSAGPKVRKDPRKLKVKALEEIKALKEVKSKRTQYSKTYELGDNRFKTEAYQTPIHYRDKHNQLVDIDNTLISSKYRNYDWENQANQQKVYFAGKTGEKKLALAQQGKYTLAWSLLEDEKVQAKVNGNTILYSGIKDKVDLKYTISNSQVKEDIILTGQGAPNRFKFRLVLDNLDYQSQEDGSIKLVDTSSGETIWTLAKPYMYDAAGAQSGKVKAAIALESGKPVLTITANQQWLNDPARKFPITIDPTLQPDPVNGRDTFISDKNPTENYRADNYLYVGQTDTFGNTQSFFYFPGLDNLDKDITIQKAEFFAAYGEEGTMGAMDLYPVKWDWQWDTDSLDWNLWQQNRSLGAKVATASGSNDWWQFNVKSLVQGWVDNPSTNFGLTLISASSGYKQIVSCDNSAGAKRPKLVFTYSKGDQQTVPADFKLHLDRKTGLISADGTVVEDAKVYLKTSDGRTFTTSAGSSGEWKKEDLSFAKGKTHTVSMYYEYDIKVTDEEGNETTETITSETTSQKFLIARYSKQARTKKLAKFYYKDGTKAAKLKEDNNIQEELELVVGDYIMILDPLSDRDMPYTGDHEDMITQPDQEYRLREKIRPIYGNGEVVGDSIDAATGNFFVLETDLSFDAKGLPVEFTRTLNSQRKDGYRGPLGLNWEFSYTKMLVMYEDGSLEVTGGDGGGYFFYPNGGGYRSDYDVTERLEKNGDGTFSLFTRYNVEYHFDLDGMLDRISDLEGNAVTLNYDPEGLLYTVTDAGDRSTTLYYDDDLGRVELVVDPEGRQVDYVYDTAGRLSQVIDPNGGVVTYKYIGYTLMIDQVTGSFDPTGKIGPTEYIALDNEYDPQGRVVKQSDGENYEVGLSYDSLATTVTDKNQQQFTYNFNREYRITSVQGPASVAFDSVKSQGTTQGAKFGSDKLKMILAAETSPEGTSGSLSTTGIPYASKITLAEYGYDDEGNRNLVVDAKEYETKYIYEDHKLTVERNDGKTTQYFYNNNYDLIRIIDPLKKETHMTYEGGELTSVTNDLGQTTYYHKEGNVLTVTDPMDKKVTYRYDDKGDLRSVTDGRDNTTWYQYDGISRLKEVIDPRENHTYYEYDDNGNLLEVSYPIGKVVNSYDYSNNLIGTKDAEENVTLYHYDKKGNVKEEINDLLETTITTYDGNDNPRTVLDANDNLTEYRYNAVGWLKEIIEPGGGDTTRYFYDLNGNRDGVKDPEGLTTTYQYDDLNRLQTIIDPLSQETKYEYDDMGNLRYYTGIGEETTEYKYDDLYRVELILDPLQQETKFAYDPSGNRETMTNALDQTFTYRYDGNNNLEQIIDPEGKTTTFRYDENNNREAMIDALGQETIYKYDANNRLEGVIDPLKQETGVGYYANGNREWVKDGRGNTTHFEYDEANRLRFVRDAKGHTTEYQYDKVGNLRFFIDANTHVTEYQYNDKNLLEKQINHLEQNLKQTTTFEYYKNGNLKAKTDAKLNRVEYDYDDANRLTGIYYPDDTYVEYGYNDKGKREWMEDYYGTTWYDYDDLGRLKAVTNQDDQTVEYDYNKLGQKTLVRYPDEKEVRYGYDKLNRLETVTDRLDKVTTYKYDDLGRRTKTILPNGVETGYDYNIANQLTGITSINANQKLLAKYEYDYDKAGNRKYVIENVENTVYTTHYQYDPLNQLEEVLYPDGSQVTYDYDPVGNRKLMTYKKENIVQTTNYEYNEVNELIKLTNPDKTYTEYKYDPNGNLVTKIEPDNVITNYQWDYENRLTNVKFHQGKWVGFEYDGDGNRITKYRAMTQPTYKNNDGKGNDPGYTPPGQAKIKAQQAGLIYMLMKGGNGKGGGGGNGGGNSGGGGGNSGGNGGGNSGGNGGGNSGGNSGGNGGGNSGGNGGGNSGDNGNGNDGAKSPAKAKTNNGPQNKDLSKEDRNKKKQAAKAKGQGYRQKGKYNNRGKHLGWYKNGKLPGEEIEVTYYLNDVSDPLTQVLMTYGEDGKHDAAYSYGLERLMVEALDETRPESQDPLYYLYDGMGSVAYMVKPDGNFRDKYRYDAYGKPYPGDTKLSEDGRINLHNTYGYTGEMWDEESKLLYLRARYYEPATGRFLSRDTYPGELENPLSKNLYAYVQNNPVNYIDPTGNMAWHQIDNLGFGMVDSVRESITDTVQALANPQTYLAIWDLGKAIAKGNLPLANLAKAIGASALQPINYLRSQSKHVFKEDPTDAEVFEYGKQLGHVVQLALGSSAALKVFTKAVPKFAKILKAVIKDEAGFVGKRPSIHFPEGAGKLDLNIKPVTSNQKLNNIIDNLYKAQNNPNKIGNGTTMDAIRAELQTGTATGGKFHTTKGQESINGLNNLLNKGNLSPEDANIARALIQDLTNALAGK